MSDVNWEAVEELDRLLMSSGFSSTWAGRFIHDVLASRQTPKGRGLTILQEFLARDWAPLVSLAATAEEMAKASPVDAGWLLKFAETVRNGYDIPEWKMKRFEEIKAKLESETARHLNEDELTLVRSLILLGNGRHPRWWAERPGQAKRFESITHAVNRGEPIYDVDLTWLKSLFKGAIAELTDGKHPIGALRYVDGTMCYVTSAPYVNKEWLRVAIDVVQTGSSQARPTPFYKIKIRGPTKKEQ